MMRKAITLTFLVLLCGTCAASKYRSGKPKVAITFDNKDALMAFAAGDIKKALLDCGHRVDAGPADVKITFEIWFFRIMSRWACVEKDMALH